MGGKFFLYPYREGEELELKKAHPCGSKRWRVLRSGAEIKILCLGCGQILSLPRSRIEKMTRKVSAEPAHIDRAAVAAGATSELGEMKD